MSAIVVAGDTSGSVTLQAPAVSGSTVLTLPAVSGTLISSGGAASFTDLTTTGNTILGDASTDTLNVGNGDLIKDASGYVGIGLAPSASGYKLQVGSGDGNCGIQLTRTGANSSNWVMAVGGGGANTLIWYDDVAASTRMSLNASGDLLLNRTTTIDSSKFALNTTSGSGVQQGIVINNSHGFGAGVGTAASGLTFTRMTGGTYVPVASVQGWNRSESTSNGGELAFSTQQTVAGGLVERMRIFYTGGVSIGNTTDPGATNLSVAGTGKFGTTVGVGAATPSTSGAGITFPATQSASTDANTLDDYEEGTWTPTIAVNQTSTTGITYSVQTGRYTKVGNLVHVQGYFLLTNKGAGSGNLTIINLPFPNNNIANSYAAPIFGIKGGITGLAGYSLTGDFGPNATGFTFYAGNATAQDGMTFANITNSFSSEFSFTYLTA
jgi:hypothetical protein